jgi:hypothetical protein
VSSILALLLLGVLASLVPLAHVSPPDPTWIVGLYDDADFDDVIAIVSAEVAANPTTSAVAVPEARAHRPPQARAVVRGHRLRLAASRSPPFLPA